MPAFEQFKYYECLSNKSLTALPSFLRITPSTSEDVLLIRLLTGTINIENTTFNIKINQRTNYILYDFKSNTKISTQTIIDGLNIYNISIKKKQTEEYFKKNYKFGNQKFFKNLLLELTNYFYQKEKKSYATAFLHLYRATELVSYCFPLFYASKAPSYEKSYKYLKEFFTQVEGELNFYKKFINEHLFKDEPLLDIPLPISITAPNDILQEQYFKAFKKLCDNNIKNINIKSATPNSEIVITRRGLTSLHYDLRNRYFHLLTGDSHDNFSSSELAEIDSFYKIINEHILNWLSVIYIEIISQTIEK